MERYKYRAMNARGRLIRGVVTAANEVDLHGQLQTANLELLDCKPLSKGRASSFGLKMSRVTIRDLIQLFIHMDQMQSAGVPLLEALSDIRDTTENTALRDMMSEIYRDVSDGSALSEAMARHPKVFKPIYVSLVKAGEDTGDLTFSYKQLIKYLKWMDEMQSRVRKATRYPIIVSGVVILTVVVMMGFVVPQIVDFITKLDQELPFYTTALIATSDFFSNPLFHLFGLPVPGALFVLMVPIFMLASIKTLKEMSANFSYHIDVLTLKMPIFGSIIRKITIARYARTFGAMFSAGIDVVNALKSAKNTVSNMAMLEALEAVEDSVQAGSPLSEAFGRSGEFPSLVIRMVRIGEESGNLTPVLDQVAEFYTQDVDEAVQGLITMIEPMLTGVMGILILWIAVGVFGPIYESFGGIDF